MMQPLGYCGGVVTRNALCDSCCHAQVRNSDNRHVSKVNRLTKLVLEGDPSPQSQAAHL